MTRSDWALLMRSVTRSDWALLLDGMMLGAVVATARASATLRRSTEALKAAHEALTRLAVVSEFWRHQHDDAAARAWQYAEAWRAAQRHLAEHDEDGEEWKR